MNNWTRDTIDAKENWYHPLPQICRDISAKINTPDILSCRLGSHDLLACRQALQSTAFDLENGRGFAIVRLPDYPLDPACASLLYWIVGQGLGLPFMQNVQGALLYDVRDTGQDVAQGARFSVTNYDSSYHTDNSFGLEILDYVGLLCLQVAKSGGLSQIVSGHSALEELKKNHAEDLAILKQPFPFDRRGGLKEGDSPTIAFPVIQEQGELLFRYLRYWIEVGQEKSGQPLTPAQVHALDTLDRVLNLPELRVEFDLQPGDMYFINNRWTLHNRTAFQDHETPEKKRHLLRLWLRRPL
ncbi:MAG: TauD/TfdA family dioxygenase [Gemmataceae bacterium]|nr:TauD/TfdA family dioxygenase [Gemmataceae bacterium]